MSSLIVVKPERVSAVITASAGLAFTADPKEAIAIPEGGQSIVVDYGRAVTVDTAYAGYHTASASQGWAVTASDASGNGSSYLTPKQAMAPLGLGYPYHALMRGTVVTSRYFRFDFDSAGGGYMIGVLALGRSFQPIYGHEYGSGRPVTDTGSASRLFGGGFGIDEGVRATGWQWTMGDLTDAEVRTFYQTMRDVGSTRSVLVVEDPDQTDGLNERIHWGLLQRVDAYERFAPGASRWSFRIDDWA